MFFSFSYFSSTNLYDSYKKVSSYRSISVSTPLPASIIHIISSWHDSSYADFVWINLVQFIGESFWSSWSLELSHTLLKYITDISPRFSHAYELDLLLVPIIPDSFTWKAYITARKQVQNAMNHAEWAFPILCNMEKIKK